MSNISSDYINTLSAFVANESNNKVVFVGFDSPDDNLTGNHVISHATVTRLLGIKSTVSAELLNTVQVCTITATFDETYNP